MRIIYLLKGGGKVETTYKEKLIYGSKATILKRENHLNIYKIDDDTGETIMTSYNIMDGIEVVYNDVHMESVFIDLDPPDGLLKGYVKMVVLSYSNSNWSLFFK